MKVLYINHNKGNHCGVHSYGLRSFEILKNSKENKFIYCEPDDVNELNRLYCTYSPEVIIYNYTDGLMGWANTAKEICAHSKHIALYHDILPSHIKASSLMGNFDARILIDPTLPNIKGWFPTVRPIFDFDIKYPKNEIVNIGSFGFFFGHKYFHDIIFQAKKEFDTAVINLHITNYSFANQEHTENFNKLCAYLKTFETKQHKINITTDYLSDNDILHFLAKNDLNVFAYAYNYGSGVSSVIDYAVSVEKPIFVNNSYQFRHVFDRLISSSFRSSIENGNAEVLKLKAEWSNENFVNQYNNIVNEVYCP